MTGTDEKLRDLERRARSGDPEAVFDLEIAATEAFGEREKGLRREDFVLTTPRGVARVALDAELLPFLLVTSTQPWDPRSPRSSDGSLFYRYSVDIKSWHLEPWPPSISDGFLVGEREWLEEHVTPHVRDWLSGHLEDVRAYRREAAGSVVAYRADEFKKALATLTVARRAFVEALETELANGGSPLTARREARP